MDITILVSSQGKNLEMAQALGKMIEEKNSSFEIIDLCELDLPLYTPKKDADIPKDAETLKEKLLISKSFIFLAPEYNGSIPPAMVNAITWISRCGKDWREAFNNKPAIVGTHSGGGGVHVLGAMRMQLSYIGINVLGRVLHTNYSKPLNEESAHTCLDSLIKFT